MRIEGPSITGTTSRSGSARRASDGSFSVGGGDGAARAAATAPMSATASIDALLALQAIEDPLFARRKAVRRGNALLDTLEAIKADLLVGQVSEGRLNQLMVLIGQARQRDLPELDDVLDDIELRARVELAKFGRFPA